MDFGVEYGEDAERELEELLTDYFKERRSAEERRKNRKRRYVDEYRGKSRNNDNEDKNQNANLTKAYDSFSLLAPTATARTDTQSATKSTPPSGSVIHADEERDTGHSGGIFPIFATERASWIHKYKKEFYFSKSDERRLRGIWSEIVAYSGGLEEMGKKIFEIQFSNYPGDIVFRKDFKGMTLQRLITLPDYRRFCYDQMWPLDYAIANLHNFKRFYNTAYRCGRNLGIDGIDNTNIRALKNFGYHSIATLYQYIKSTVFGVTPFRGHDRSSPSATPHTSAGSRAKGSKQSGRRKETKTKPKNRDVSRSRNADSYSSASSVEVGPEGKIPTATKTLAARSSKTTTTRNVRANDANYNRSRKTFKGGAGSKQGSSTPTKTSADKTTSSRGPRVTDQKHGGVRGARGLTPSSLSTPKQSGYVSPLRSVTRESASDCFSLIQRFFKYFGLAFLKGFASTNVVSANERRLLREHFQRVLDKWGVTGLGWEIMEEFFLRCPRGHEAFEVDGSERVSPVQERDSFLDSFNSNQTRRSRGSTQYGYQTIGAGKRYTSGKLSRSKSKSHVVHKDSMIVLQEHVTFYVSLLYRCIRQLDDTRIIMSIVEDLGFEHAAVKIDMEDYAIFWQVSVDVVTRDLPENVLPAFDRFFEFLERCFSMGLEEASAESMIISSCRLDMGQINDLQRCWSALQLRLGEQAIAAAFYNDIITNFPSCRNYFKTIRKGSTFARTIGNMNDVRKHASQVVSRLTNYMGNLHHLSEVNEDLKELGMKHAARYHINEEVVEQFVSSMATTVADLLAKENLFDSAHCAAWKRFFFMILTFLCEGVRTHAENPVTEKTLTSYGLTPQQAQSVAASFAHLLKTLGPLEIGIAILRKWFEIDPDAVKRHVEGTAVVVDADAFVHSDTLKALALQTVDAFHVVIFNLSKNDSRSVSRDIVKTLGRDHTTYRGRIRDTDINGFCQGFLAAVRHLLGSALTDLEDTAWSAFLESTGRFFNQGLNEGYALMAEGRGEYTEKKRLTRTMTYKLAPKLIETIRKGWATMTANPGQESTGVEWLKLLFGLNSNIKDQYKNFSNKKLDDICQTPYMKIIAGKYMTEIGILVEHLEYPHYVIMRLENLGSFHVKMGVTIEDMMAMGGVMHYYFKEVFSRNDMPADCAEAWYRMVDIITTFMVTGFENCSPTTPHLREEGKAHEAERSFNLDAEERKLVQQSMFRAMRRWNPNVMSKKLAVLLMTKLRDLMHHICPGALPTEMEAGTISRVALHRLKDDVDRMMLGQSSYVGLLKRARRTELSKIAPEDVVACDRVYQQVMREGDPEWNEDVEAAWSHFFAERQRIFLPMLIKVMAE